MAAPTGLRDWATSFPPWSFSKSWACRPSRCRWRKRHPLHEYYSTEAPQPTKSKVKLAQDSVDFWAFAAALVAERARSLGAYFISALLQAREGDLPVLNEAEVTNRVGCSTGRSAGLAPLKILST